MGVLRPGCRVPGRKLLNNPHTVSGRPQWGTYAALDYPAATTEIKRRAKDAKIKPHGGGASARKRLDPSNLCHRVRHPELERVHSGYRALFERARILSLRMDRLDGIKLDLCIADWGRVVRELIMDGQVAHLRELARLEQARGQVRIINACKFAHLKL